MSYTTDSYDDPVIPNHLYELRPCRYRTSKDAWKHISSRDGPSKEQPPSIVRIVTWNIDFAEEECRERLNTALDYIQTDLFHCEDGRAPDDCCVLLQEVNEEAFGAILEHEWVRRWFVIVPVSPRRWPEGAKYGNVSLVSRSIAVVSAGMLEFGSSVMTRTALVTDLRLSVVEPNEREVIVRVVNTHLESLVAGKIARPRQLKLIGKLLGDEKVHSGVVCGDMNAIEMEDRMLPGQVGLRDAWRRGDDGEEGCTWGYQGKEVGRFPPSRMDKVLYTPRRGLKVDEPLRIGIGVKTPDGRFYASDHYGLATTVRVFR